MYFRDEYAFLSNFYPCNICFNGLNYKNAEACYQAQKCVHEKDKKLFIKLSGKEAKQLGRTIEIRKDWDKIKYNVMYSVCLKKFKQNTELAERLKQINGEIIEHNTWNDTFWGVYRGKGENKLGKILTIIRDELIHVHSCSDFSCGFVGTKYCTEEYCYMCKLNNCRGCNHLWDCVENEEFY